MIYMETCRVEDNRGVGGEYRILVLRSEQIAGSVLPGQFVHVRIPRRNDLVLRRPFSVFRVRNGCMEIFYKVVGAGTRVLAETRRHAALSVLGPLGRAFPDADPDAEPVLVAGGYGAAALYMVAEACRRRGTVLLGGASAGDILLGTEFESLGWRVEVATEDGSLGLKGRVTDLLDALIARRPGEHFEFFACGPEGMLRAVARRAMQKGVRAWLSFDRRMGCGVGACLACVLDVRDEGGRRRRVRVCREGPVFEAGTIVWEEDPGDD